MSRIEISVSAKVLDRLNRAADDLDMGLYDYCRWLLAEGALPVNNGRIQGYDNEAEVTGNDPVWSR